MTGRIDTEALQKLLDRATRGPWKVFRTSDGLHVLGVGDAEAGGVFDAKLGVWRSGKERDANADLAALAPDLARRVIAAEKLAEATREISYRFGEGDITRQEIESALSAWETDQ